MAVQGFDPNAAVGAGTAPVDQGTLFGISTGLATAPVTAGGNQTNIGGVLAGFYSLTHDQRQALTQQLYQGGFYSPTFYSGKNKPNFGAADDAGFAAFQSAVVRSAQSNKPVEDIIAEAVQDAQAQGGPGGQGVQGVTGGNVGGGNVYKVSTDDPAALRQLADKIGQAVLGRKPKAEDRDKIVQAITGSQAANDVQANSAAEASSMTKFAVGNQAETNKTDAAMNGVNPSATTGDVDRFMVALAGQESGDPNATNKLTGAHGAWQIMPANWSSWAKQAGLPANAPQTMDNQRVVVKNKLTEYFNKYGDWRKVAAAWYSGQPNDQSTKPQPGGPSIKAYVDSVMSKMGNVNATGAPASGIVNLPNTYIAPTTVTQTAVDPQARTEEMLRAQSPNEAAAHDFASQYQTMLQLMKGAA